MVVLLCLGLRREGWTGGAPRMLGMYGEGPPGDAPESLDWLAGWVVHQVTLLRPQMEEEDGRGGCSR